MRHLRTARLRLDAVVPSDLDDHFALLSDPEVWAHLPSGRHTSPERTMEGIEHSVGHWSRDGLGYWTARLNGDLPGTGLHAGAVVGTGGCALRVGTTWWNLYYRLTPRAWGLGLAAELVTAAIDAAHAVAPDRPVIAYLLEHNVQSRGRAERAGLSLVWRGPDAGNPDPAAVRLVYSDRALGDDLLDGISATVRGRAGLARPARARPPGPMRSPFRNRLSSRSGHRRQDQHMGRIVSNFFISLDGVVEAPNEWHFPYFDEAMGHVMGAGMETQTAFLMGRRLYDEWSEFWPAQAADMPFASHINDIRKYVVTHRPIEGSAWNNTTVLGADPVAELRAIKERTDGDIAMSGCATTVRWLLANDLLDELALLMHPIAVGEGQRLFEGTPTIPLTLISSDTLPSGVLHLRYAPAAGVAPTV